MLGLRFRSPPPASRKSEPVDSALSKFMTNADVKYIMLDQTDHSAFLIRIREENYPEVVRIFAHLYCDFLERSESPEFVLGVLDPQCQRGSFETDLADLASIEDPVLRAMNIGYFYGPEVLAQSLRKPHAPRTVNEVHL